MIEVSVPLPKMHWQLNHQRMEIIYIITHLVMAMCIISILYVYISPYMSMQKHEQLLAINQFYARSIKFSKVLAIQGYKIAMTLLITYVK